MVRCWDRCPSNRPDFEEILSSLRKIEFFWLTSFKVNPINTWSSISSNIKIMKYLINYLNSHQYNLTSDLEFVSGIRVCGRNMALVPFHHSRGHILLGQSYKNADWIFVSWIIAEMKEKVSSGNNLAVDSIYLPLFYIDTKYGVNGCQVWVN